MSFSEEARTNKGDENDAGFSERTYLDDAAEAQCVHGAMPKFSNPKSAAKEPLRQFSATNGAMRLRCTRAIAVHVTAPSTTTSH